VTENFNVNPPSHSFPPLVIGTEKEPSKIKKALSHVEEGFEGKIPTFLRILEGDLLKTLAEANFPDNSIDALLLDIWAPLALPTLKLLLPVRYTSSSLLFLPSPLTILHHSHL
jgi:hypothetical protein